METPTFTPSERAAFAALLDDSSPVVRRRLLDHFSGHPESSRAYLLELAEAKNRTLAWHARWFLTELRFSDPVAEFRGFIQSLNYELETGALLLARTVLPTVDAGACTEALDRLAERCRELVAEPSSVRERCRVINRVLYHEAGFRGNVENYTDPLNSLLPEVLTRKKGIPISLGLVYLLVAARLGVPLEPVGMPGHFVVGCFTEEPTFFIDAFEQGAFRTPAELLLQLRAQGIEPSLGDLAPAPVREVLARCCRNLVNHYTAAGDESHARLFASFVAEFDAAYERHSA
ncbi:MAG: transglutaminase-like domain-containing protein [Verrucomicrobia bacterium]|nr:transglutaminase-like domain-containing protein [Verrucomicrobiota bacterium]